MSAEEHPDLLECSDCGGGVLALVETHRADSDADVLCSRCAGDYSTPTGRGSDE